MEEVGRIIQVKDDQVIVQIEESGACSSCNSCSIEGDSKKRILAIPNSINAKQNDLVILALSTSKSIFISLFLYIFPIVMMISGYFIGEHFESGKLTSRGDSPFAILLSVVFLLVSFVVIFLVDRVAKKKNKLSPELKGFYQASFHNQTQLNHH